MQEVPEKRLYRIFHAFLKPDVAAVVIISIGL